MNLFFVKERCATSLSIAGYLMNRGEKCVEVLEPSIWIIPSKDETSLCFAATNVIEILKNNDVHRVFVQGSSRNINAIILASFLTELDLFVIDYTEASISPNLSLLGNIFKFNAPEETKLNFLHSGSTTKNAKEVIDENKILLSSHYPPEKNWFYSHNFFSIIPATSYSHNNYSLPNYLEEGASVNDQQWTEALKICDFFKKEASSSWKSFEKQIFTLVEKNDRKN